MVATADIAAFSKSIRFDSKHKAQDIRETLRSSLMLESSITLPTTRLEAEWRAIMLRDLQEETAGEHR